MNMHKLISSILFKDCLVDICVYDSNKCIIYENILDDIVFSKIKRIQKEHNVTLCLIPKNTDNILRNHLISKKIVYEEYSYRKDEGVVEAVYNYSSRNKCSRSHDKCSNDDSKKFNSNKNKWNICCNGLNNDILNCSKYSQIYKREGKNMVLTDKCLNALGVIGEKNCLFKEIDYSITVAGRNMLRMWIAYPQRDADTIQKRHYLQKRLWNVHKEICKKLKKCRNNLVQGWKLRDRLIRMKNINGFRSIRQLYEMLRSGFEINGIIGGDIKLCNKRGYMELLEMIERQFDDNGIRDGYDSELDELRQRRNELVRYLDTIASEMCLRRGHNVKIVYFPQFGYLVESTNGYNKVFENEMFRIKDRGYYKTEEMDELDKLLGDVETEINTREVVIMGTIERAVLNTDFTYLNEFIGEVDAICSMIKYAEQHCAAEPIFITEDIISIGGSTYSNIKTLIYENYHNQLRNKTVNNINNFENISENNIDCTLKNKCNTNDKNSDNNISNKSDKTNINDISNRSDKTNINYISNKSDKTNINYISNISDETNINYISNKIKDNNINYISNKSDKTNINYISNEIKDNNINYISNKSDKTNINYISNEIKDNNINYISNISDDTDINYISNISDDTDINYISNISDETNINYNSNEIKDNNINYISNKSDKTNINYNSNEINNNNINYNSNEIKDNNINYNSNEINNNNINYNSNEINNNRSRYYKIYNKKIKNKGIIDQLSNKIIKKRMICTQDRQIGVEVGKLVVLVQSGFYAPFEYIKIPLFDNILLKSSGKESIGTNRSRFLNEIVLLNNIIANITEKSLCIIEGIGLGTDYLSGLGLFLSVSEFLKPKMLIISTDFDLTQMKLARNPLIDKWFNHFTIDNYE